MRLRIPAVYLLLLLTVSTTSGDIRFHGIAVPSGAQHAWVTMKDTTAIYYTSDFGITWQSQFLPTSRDFYDVFFLDSLRGWVCGAAGAIWGTTDGGRDWSMQNLGGPMFATRIRFSDDSLGWASGSDASVLHTTNGGNDWGFTPLPNWLCPVDTVDFEGVWFTDADHGWLVSGRMPTADTFAGGQGYIIRTTNAGDTWTRTARSYLLDFFDVTFTDRQNGFIVGGDDRTWQACILRTTDGGENWLGAAVPHQARLLRSISFAGGWHGWACGINGTIVHTSDGGYMWILQNSPVDDTLFDIEFCDTLRGMIAASSAVLRTSDGGLTWTQAVPAIAERPEPERAEPLPGPTIVGDALWLGQSGDRPSSGGTVRHPMAPAWSQSPVLLDITGRKVMELAPGPNDVRHLSPGVYFISTPCLGGIDRGPSCTPAPSPQGTKMQKVVLAR